MSWRAQRPACPHGAPTPARRWPASSPCVWLLLAAWSSGRIGAEADKGEQKVKTQQLAIWPTLLLHVRRAKLPGKKDGSLTSEDQRKNLAKTGLEGYRRYTEEILPKELKVDPVWRKLYESSEGMPSRDNLGFLRWQKAAWALATHPRDIDWELNWEGVRVPVHKALSYDWPRLYKSLHHKALVKLVNAHAKKLVQAGDGHPEDKYRVFPWVEVYRPGEYQEPIARTGAPACGIYVAQAEGKQELVFIDERAQGPPFGRQHKVPLVQGELWMFPAWAANMMSVNSGNGTNVYYRFWISTRGGVDDFDWEDDPLGNMIRNKRIMVNASELQLRARSSHKAESKARDEL